MRRLPSTLRVHLALITVSVLFGGHYVFLKQILTVVPAKSWVLFRIGAATIVLVPLAFWLRKQPGWPNQRTWWLLAVAAFLGVALNQVLFTEGLARTTPEHSAVVTSCIPTWTLIVAVVVGQEQLRLRSVLAIVSALCGVLYLLGFDRMLFDGGRGFGGETLVGDLLTAANGFAFACHLVMLRTIGREVDASMATAILFAQGALMIALWSGPSVTDEHVSAVLVSPFVWFAIYSVLGATVLTYLLNTWALRHTHSSNVALYINIQPLIAAGLNYAMGSPPPGHRFFVALGLVAFGLWLQTRRKANHAEVAQPTVPPPTRSTR